MCEVLAMRDCVFLVLFPCVCGTVARHEICVCAVCYSGGVTEIQFLRTVSVTLCVCVCLRNSGYVRMCVCVYLNVCICMFL